LIGMASVLWPARRNSVRRGPGHRSGPAV